jgi:hypothetical protein
MFRYWSTLGRGTPAPHTLDPGVVMLLTVSLDGWMELLNQVHGPPSTHTRQTPQTRRHQPGRCLVCYYPSGGDAVCGGGGAVVAQCARRYCALAPFRPAHVRHQRAVHHLPAQVVESSGDRRSLLVRLSEGLLLLAGKPYFRPCVATTAVRTAPRQRTQRPRPPRRSPPSSTQGDRCRRAMRLRHDASARVEPGAPPQGAAW